MNKVMEAVFLKKSGEFAGLFGTTRLVVVLKGGRASSIKFPYGELETAKALAAQIGQPNCRLIQTWSPTR